ncbi:unnamed protein product [Cunninghamella echinulata]
MDIDPLIKLLTSNIIGKNSNNNVTNNCNIENQTQQNIVSPQNSINDNYFTQLLIQYTNNNSSQRPVYDYKTIIISNIKSTTHLIQSK